MQKRYDNLHEALEHIDKIKEALDAIDQLTGNAEVYRIRVSLSYLDRELYSEAKAISQLYRERENVKGEK